MIKTRIHHIFILIIVVELISSLMIHPAAARNRNDQTSQSNVTYVPGEVVLAFEHSMSPVDYNRRAEILASSVGAQVVRQYQDLALLRVPIKADIPSLAARLSIQIGVKTAEPNYISWLPEIKSKDVPFYFDSIERTMPDGKIISVSVERLKTMRSLRKAGARMESIPTYPNDIWSSWGNHYTQWWMIWPSPQPSPTVCVLDSGIDRAHPDLAGKVINGYDFVNADSLSNDDNGHGTLIAGIIAAKISNGGIAGISNGKVLAVKVVSAQGMATSYDIAAGVQYCAGAAGVKVIQLSPVGAAASDIEYEALQSAIIDHHKLVIAPAGDNQSALPVYPAAWAQDLLIGPGLISVGAATNYPRDIDIHHDGNQVVHVSAFQCAANFSNYGAWIKMIAPGESIPSSTPVSYPFWLNYVYQAGSSYDFFSGTPVAAAHVAGASARLWSIHPAWMNKDIASWLQSQGDSLNTTSDQGIVDKDHAWAGGYTANNAPFCWPGTGWGTADMSGSTYLNLAKAMQRSARRVGSADATTGLPVVGTTIRAVNNPRGTLYNTTLIADVAQLYADLINLPANVPINFQVSKPGLTAGFQTFTTGAQAAGEYHSDPSDLVPLPSNKENYAIANWDQAYDLDLYVWGPGLKPDSLVSGLHPGSLMVYPYMRWFGFRFDPDSNAQFPVEAVRIINANGKNIPSAIGRYSIILHALDNGISLTTAQPVIRHWNSGIIRVIYSQPNCPPGNPWWWAYNIQFPSSRETFHNDAGCNASPP